MIVVKSKDEIDIMDLARAYGQPKRQGMEWYMLCPLPEHRDSAPSCAFNVEKQMWYCHGCGNGGDVFDLIMQIEGTDFPGAIRVLKDQHGIDYRSRGVSTGRSEAKDQLYEVIGWAIERYHDTLRGFGQGLYIRPESTELKLANTYLADRGFDLGDINKWQLGFAPNGPASLAIAASAEGIDRELLVKAGFLRRGKTSSQSDYRDVLLDRLVIPVRDRIGRAIGFVARRVQGQSQKYLNTAETPLFKKGQILMNWNQAVKKARQTQRLVLVEGPLDLLRLHKLGVEETICTMGTALSAEQAASLASVGVSKYVLFGDGDEAGNRASLKRGEALLLLEQNVYVVRTPPDRDPDNWGWQAPRIALHHLGTPLTFAHFAVNYANPQDAMEKADAAAYFEDILARIPGDNRRAVLVEEVSQLLGIPFTVNKGKTLLPVTKAPAPEKSQTPRIELDLIYALIEHWDDSLIIEIIFLLSDSIFSGLFTPSSTKVLNWLMRAIERADGDFELAAQVDVPEEIQEVCTTALQLNAGKNPTPGFLSQISQWLIIEKSKQELERLKSRLSMYRGDTSLLDEYVEMSRKRLS